MRLLFIVIQEGQVKENPVFIFFIIVDIIKMIMSCS